MTRTRKFNGLDSFGELLLPADSAFEEQAVLLDDDVGGVPARAFAESSGELLAVLAGVRKNRFHRKKLEHSAARRRLCG
jgi:hypothetical protein